MPRFEDQVVIVTGGAQGIGEATVRLFAAEGARVVIADVLEEKGAALAADIDSAVGNSAAERAVFSRLDVSDEANWAAVVADTVARFGRIDVLVNNAGMMQFSPVEGLDAGAAHTSLSVNLLGPMLGAKHVAPVMKEAGKGSIVNISSMAGLLGLSGFSTYTASKWGLRGLTKTQALELGPSGIRVCSVHPGGVDTEMANPDHRTGEELQAGYQDNPLRRIGQPDEIARVIAFLASDDASYMNGAELAVDGGSSAGIYYPGMPGAPS